jgi:cell pole-organizing protein PopZ
MVSEENNQEMSVNEILSSIKEVISNEKISKSDEVEDEVLELTDVISDDDDSILLDDVVETNDIPIEQPIEGDLAEDLRNNLNLDEGNFLSDLSIDDIIKETVRETLNEWFANNLKPIVEESVKDEVAKLFKKRN